MKQKLIFWVAKYAPKLLPFLNISTEQSVAKTGIKKAVEKALTPEVILSLKEQSTLVFNREVAKYFKSSDSTIADAITISNLNYKPNEAVIFYGKMKLQNPTIMQAYDKLVEPSLKLHVLGVLNKKQLEARKKEIDVMFVKKFQAVITNNLKVDIGIDIGNLILRDDVKGIASIKFHYLNDILIAVNPATKKEIINKIIIQINGYVVTDARNAATNALQSLPTLPTPVSMMNIVSRLNNIASPVSPSRFAYAKDIFSKMYTNKLMTEQDVQYQLHLHPANVRKGYTQAIEQYNNRSMNGQRPIR